MKTEHSNAFIIILSYIGTMFYCFPATLHIFFEQIFTELSMLAPRIKGRKHT